MRTKVNSRVSCPPAGIFLPICLGWLLLASCLPGGASDQDNPVRDSIPTLWLVTADEPGQRLTLTGTVVGGATGEPIPGARVYLYHADANGEYQPTDPVDESTARLSGEIFTGESGQFRVHTIVPREYDQPGNRHIHLHSVQADGYREMGGVILFEQDVNDEVRAWAIETGFGNIIELEQVEGIMQGSLTIELDRE